MSKKQINKTTRNKTTRNKTTRNKTTRNKTTRNKTTRNKIKVRKQKKINNAKKQKKSILFGGGQLPRKIVELINSFAGGEHYVEPNTDTTKKQRNRLIKLISTVPPSYGLINLTTALTSYQRFSADINGFLRSNDVSGELLDTIIHSSEDQRGNLAKLIKTIDFMFNNDLCPRFEKQTILFRATENPYEKHATELNGGIALNKGYISTTKTIDNLFNFVPYMEEGKPTPFIINLFIVDEGVPYLDLEIYSSGDDYRIHRQFNDQKEVLLPRNLTFLEEDLYNYKHMDLGGTDIDYTLYVFRVSI
jgi:hypothetical protein